MAINDVLTQHVAHCLIGRHNHAARINYSEWRGERIGQRAHRAQCCHGLAPLRFLSDPVQCRGEFGDKHINVFNPDRDTEEPFGHAQRQTRLST